MSPTSYQLLYSAIFKNVVPVTGLEPVQYCYREILSLLSKAEKMFFWNSLAFLMIHWMLAV